MSFRSHAKWTALALLLGSFAVRLVNSERGILSDEIITYWVSQLPESRIVEERLAHNHLPTYFLLMRQWLMATGTSEWTLRFPSVIAGSLAVTAFFLFCSGWVRLRVAALAAAFLSLNATHLFVSQWARMYALTALLEVLFAWIFLSDLRRPSWLRYLCYAAIVVAGCCLHLLFLQMAVIVVCFLIWEHRQGAGSRRKPPGTPTGPAEPPPKESAVAAPPSVRGSALAGNLCRYGVPFLLGWWLLFVWFHHAQAFQRDGQETKPATTLSWLDPNNSPIPVPDEDHRPPKRRFVDPSRTWLRVAFGDFSYWPVLQSGGPKYLTRAVLYGLAGLLLWAAFRPALGLEATALKTGRAADGPARRDAGRALRLAVLWAILPALLMTLGAMMFAWVPGPSPRWLVGTAAPWALIFAWGVWRIPTTPGGQRMVAVVLLILAGAFSWGWLRNPGDGLREAFSFWQTHARPDEKVFLAHRGYLEQAMRFYRVSPPPESLRSGTLVDDYRGPEVARLLADFAGTDSSVWILHYRFPGRAGLERAWAALPPPWRTERAFEFSACTVYRLWRASDGR